MLIDASAVLHLADLLLLAGKTVSFLCMIPAANGFLIQLNCLKPFCNKRKSSETKLAHVLLELLLLQETRWEHCTSVLALHWYRRPRGEWSVSLVCSYITQEQRTWELRSSIHSGNTEKSIFCSATTQQGYINCGPPFKVWRSWQDQTCTVWTASLSLREIMKTMFNTLKLKQTFQCLHSNGII